MPLPFLSSLMPSPDHTRVLAQRLSRFSLLAGLSESAIRRLIAEACWFGLPGGSLLKRDSENETALFLVVAGALGVMVDDGHGHRRLVAQVPPGETVGEVSLFTEEHSAELVALRDSELMRIGPEAFEALVAKHPRVMIDMMRVMARRLVDATKAPREQSPKTFAVVPLQQGLAGEPVAHRIAAALVDMGAKAAVLDATAAGQSAEWFHTFEAAHDVVIYRGDAPGTPWTETCIRQADRIWLFARADRELPRELIRTAKEKVCGRPELLLLHKSGEGGALPEHFALKSPLFESHHHIRQDHAEDIGRLARCVAGRAVGLVLGGGGARGFAHIGVVKALKEAGVPFDYLGGVSMGAIIAAGLAAEWSLDELSDRMRAVFVTSKPLSDYTLPLIALVRGRKVTELFRTHFGSLRIEDLARPYFCISSDLTTGRIHEHRVGFLWRALRASAALPGIMPPVNLRGHLLVDGGVMNNLPVDLMRARRIGPLIASDVTGEIDFSVRDSRYGERPVWRLIWQRMRGTPSIFDVLMRTGTVGSEAQRRLVRDEADFLFEPPLENLNPLDWKAFDRAVAEGYEHAARQIDRQGIPLTTLWCDGPAVAVPPRSRQ
jgi:NTE family protein